MRKLVVAAALLVFAPIVLAGRGGHSGWHGAGWHGAAVSSGWHRGGYRATGAYWAPHWAGRGVYGAAFVVGPRYYAYPVYYAPYYVAMPAYYPAYTPMVVVEERMYASPRPLPERVGPRSAPEPAPPQYETPRRDDAPAESSSSNRQQGGARLRSKADRN